MVIIQNSLASNELFIKTGMGPEDCISGDHDFYGRVCKGVEYEAGGSNYFNMKPSSQYIEGETMLNGVAYPVYIRKPFGRAYIDRIGEFNDNNMQLHNTAEINHENLFYIMGLGKNGIFSYGKDNPCVIYSFYSQDESVPFYWVNEPSQSWVRSVKNGGTFVRTWYLEPADASETIVKFSPSTTSGPKFTMNSTEFNTNKNKYIVTANDGNNNNLHFTYKGQVNINDTLWRLIYSKDHWNLCKTT